MVLRNILFPTHAGVRNKKVNNIHSPKIQNFYTSSSKQQGEKKKGKNRGCRWVALKKCGSTCASPVRPTGSGSLSFSHLSHKKVNFLQPLFGRRIKKQKPALSARCEFFERERERERGAGISEQYRTRRTSAIHNDTRESEVCDVIHAHLPDTRREASEASRPFDCESALFCFFLPG